MQSKVARVGGAGLFERVAEALQVAEAAFEANIGDGGGRESF